MQPMDTPGSVELYLTNGIKRTLDTDRTTKIGNVTSSFIWNTE